MTSTLICSIFGLGALRLSTVPPDGNRLLRRFIQTQAAAASARSRQPPTAPPVAGPASCAAVPSSVALGKAGPGGGDGKGGGGDGAGSTNDTSVLVTCTALALVMVIALTEAGPALRLGKRSSIPALLSTFAATFLTVTLGVVPLLLCGQARARDNGLKHKSAP